jgi:MerR family transcriptional regulator/heat shock protein HspR
MQEKFRRISRERTPVAGPDSGQGVYGISVAAELVDMGVQTLRLYEARGLIEPARTGGGTRLYSADDVDRLRRIGGLLNDGLNLAGIAMVFNLEAQNARLQAEKEEHQWLSSTRNHRRRPPRTPAADP